MLSLFFQKPLRHCFSLHTSLPVLRLHMGTSIEQYIPPVTLTSRRMSWMLSTLPCFAYKSRCLDSRQHPYSKTNYNSNSTTLWVTRHFVAHRKSWRYRELWRTCNYLPSSHTVSHLTAMLNFFCPHGHGKPSLTYFNPLAPHFNV